MKLVTCDRVSLVFTIMLTVFAGCDLQNSEYSSVQTKISAVKFDVPQEQPEPKLSQVELFDQRVDLLFQINETGGQVQTMKKVINYLDELEKKWEIRTWYPCMDGELESLREFRNLLKEKCYDVKERQECLKFQLEAGRNA